MDPNKIDQLLGGSTTLGNQQSSTAAPGMATSSTPSQMGMQSSSTPLNPSQIDQSLGGSTSINGNQSDQNSGNFLQKVGNFFTGSTQAAGKDIGDALASGGRNPLPWNPSNEKIAPSTTDDYIDTLKSWTDVTNNLLKAIKTKQTSGQDTSKLQMALIDHQASQPKPEDFQGSTFGKSNEQIIGDIAGSGLEALSGGVLEGAAAEEGTALGRIAKTAAIGAGYGATSGAIGSMQNNAQSLGSVAGSALEGAGIGAATGGIGAGLGELLTKATTSLPPRIIQQVLPQLKNPDTVDYALNNLKLGTVDSMVQTSRSALNSYDAQINAILQHPDYANLPVQGEHILGMTLNQFPNSEYTPESIIAKMKTQIPSEAKLFTTLGDGGILPLDQANRLRQQIDRVTYKSAIDSPEIKAGKDLAAAFGNSLRATVKATAPETVPIFDNYSKEINVQKALQKLAAKGDKAAFVNMSDLMSAGLGGVLGGAPGAIASAVGEKITSSPVTKVATAKAINALAPAARGAATIGRVGGVAAAKRS